MQVFSGATPIMKIGLDANAAGQTFLRSLPQGRTERLLAARLAEFKITPEWGMAFTGFGEARAGKTVSKLPGPNGA
jgi:hypothetical protein